MPPSDSVPKPRAPDSPVPKQAKVGGALPATFIMAGPITGWDPVRRELTLGQQLIVIAGELPGVVVTQLAVGRFVRVSGHQERRTARWIATEMQVH
jgi:hypothetical protein